MIIDKLTEPRTHLESVDLTPNQKVHLWDVMARYGAKQGFSYKRFFDKGFRQWELQGIDNIKRTFLSTSYPQQLTDTEVTQIVSEPGAFYALLGKQRGLKRLFHLYICSLGMGLTASVGRFRTDDFRPWERVGVRHIMQEFENEVRNDN